MKIGYHSANVIYRYDLCVILAQGSCVSWEAGTQCGWSGWLQTDRNCGFDTHPVGRAWDSLE